MYTHGPNKGQRGPWHSCNRASCQFRGAKIAAGVDFSDESAAGVLDSIVDTPDGTEAVIYVSILLPALFLPRPRVTAMFSS